MASSLGLLIADYSDPIYKAYYLAGDDVKKAINTMYDMAAEERKICDGIVSRFGAVACKKPIILRPSFVEDEALLNLYFQEGKEPEGWVRKDDKSWNSGHSSVRMPDNPDEWAPAYVPEVGSKDADALRKNLQELYNVREEYSPFANRYSYGGNPGARFTWENIMWVSKFNFSEDSLGFPMNRPTVYKVNRPNSDYLLGFRFRRSQVKDIENPIPKKLEDGLVRISERAFKGLTDREPPVSPSWRLQRIRSGRSGLSVGDRLRLRYIL